MAKKKKVSQPKKKYQPKLQAVGRLPPKIATASSNPFDLHFNKIKKNVLGRKIQKCEVGRPTKSRHDAVDKRNKTLLQEYMKKNKTGKVMDKRIKDEKGGMNKRKAKIFEMKMKESTECKLTHGGEFLDEDNLLNDRPIDSDFEDDNDLNLLKRQDYVESVHFGGIDDHKSLGGKKSKEDFMNEAMQEKIKRQYEQEMNTALTDKLDSEFKDIRVLMNIPEEVPHCQRKSKEESIIDQLMRNSQRSKGIQEKEKEVTTDRKDVKGVDDEPKLNKEYDTVYRELMFASKINRSNEQTGSVTTKGVISSSTGPQDRMRRSRDDKVAQREKELKDSQDKRQKVIERVKGNNIVILPLIEPLLESLTVKRDPILKLKKKIKREHKGAQREIRKDSTFIKNLWLQEMQDKDADRKKKLNKILADIASDAHEAKKIKRDLA